MTLEVTLANWRFLTQFGEIWHVLSWCTSIEEHTWPVTLNEVEGHSSISELFKCASHPHLCSAAIYKISTGTPASRGPSVTARLLVQYGSCAPPWIDRTHICTNHEGYLLVTIFYTKFSWNWPHSFDNMQLFLFCWFGLKMPFSQPQNGGFWGIWPPKWEMVTTESTKGMFLHRNTSCDI